MLKYYIMEPSSLILEGEADMVVIPSLEGEIAVLAEHIHMVNLINAGLVKIYRNNKIIAKIFVENGISRIDNILSIIVEKASDLSKITREEANDRLSLAEKELEFSEKDLSKINEYHISKILLDVIDKEIYNIGQEYKIN